VETHVPVQGYLFGFPIEAVQPLVAKAFEGTQADAGCCSWILHIAVWQLRHVDQIKHAGHAARQIHRERINVEHRRCSKRIA
jgi:hypothetical protein